jgi:hypothetical protein
MSAAEGEAAETAGKRTCGALTTGLRLTAAVPGTGAAEAGPSLRMFNDCNFVDTRP